MDFGLRPSHFLCHSLPSLTISHLRHTVVGHGRVLSPYGYIAYGKMAAARAGKQTADQRTDPRNSRPRHRRRRGTIGHPADNEAIAAGPCGRAGPGGSAPTESPPVCRIMDFGKFKYQQKKRQHKGHAHQVKIKEIRVRPKTGDHDIEVKVNKAREFLAHKDKVIVTVIYRGRELAHIDEGRKVIDDMLVQLADVSKVEAPPVHHGRRMICTLAPK